MRSREGVGVLMPLGNSGEKGAFAGRSSSGPGQSLRVGKSGVREGASARWCGGRARGRGRRLESRNDRMQEGGEGGINPRTSSERLLCATHGLGTGDSARNMENPAVPLQDAV